jgi:diguanylate cyclase (GGDEF)-like protein/PAS domain S-box-containing protein
MLVYAKKDELLRKWWIYAVLYLPVAAFLYQALWHDLYFNDVIYSSHGWVSIANSSSVWYWIFIFLAGSSGLINMYLCYSKMKESASSRIKKQSFTILISIMISLFITMGYHLVTKIFLRTDVPDITSAGLLIWLVGVVYSVIKYRLMIISPALATESILKTILDAVILVNPDGMINYVNSEALELLGYKEYELLDKPFNMILPEETRLEIEDAVKKLDHGSVRNKETLYLSRRNKKIPIIFSASVCDDNYGEYIGFVAVATDITEYKRREEQIKYLSYHDQLTGLYNRRYYEEELSRLDKERNLPISIIMGDVNGLKIVNDSLGHEKGDELLIKVSEALKKGCRADDIIARLGGDEFVVLLPKTDAAQAEGIIKRINEFLSAEKVGNLDVSVSFGYKVKKQERETMREVFKDAEDLMYKYKFLHSANNSRNTIDLIMSALFEKHHREMLHSKRVGALCEAIADNMNFNKEIVYKIKIAGLMHDIGKIGIDDKTLNKPAKLTDEEWAEMRKHPEIGQRILSSATEFSEIGDYIFEHQERWDGKGYPRGLKGEEILLQARIIAVADAYDAMTTATSYRKALSKKEAMDEIKRCSGTQFDPTIAKIFVEKVLKAAWE